MRVKIGRLNELRFNPASGEYERVTDEQWTDRPDPVEETLDDKIRRIAREEIVKERGPRDALPS